MSLRFALSAVPLLLAGCGQSADDSADDIVVSAEEPAFVQEPVPPPMPDSSETPSQDGGEAVPEETAPALSEAGSELEA